MHLPVLKIECNEDFWLLGLPLLQQTWGAISCPVMPERVHTCKKNMVIEKGMFQSKELA